MYNGALSGFKRNGAVDPAFAAQLLSKLNMCSLRVGDLSVDYYTDGGYQRRTNLSRLKRKSAIKVFSRALCGAIIVNKRPDGTFWVVDGAHRLEWAKEAKAQFVDCYIISISPEHEAAYYRAYNSGRVGTKGYEDFMAALSAKDEHAMLVQELAEKGGFVIVEKASAPNETDIAHSLHTFLEKGVFSDMEILAGMCVVRRTWPHEFVGQLRILRPVIEVVRQGLKAGIALDALTSRLEVALGTIRPEDVKYATHQGPGNCWAVGARFVKSVYNKKLTAKNRIPE